MDLIEEADRYTEKESESGRTEEFLSHDASNDVVSLAPHGRYIEKYTGEQAFLLASYLTRCSAWAFRGDADGGGAFGEYHVRSSRIEVDAYEYLDILNAENFGVAVAFHGFNPDRDVDVYVGGDTSLSNRETVAEHIDGRTDDGIRVQAARRGDALYGRYAGTIPGNLVNRLGEQGADRTDDGSPQAPPRRSLSRGGRLHRGDTLAA
jgi:phage replication-related protein YjqB (UPF0714/DUF867 family)